MGRDRLNIPGGSRPPGGPIERVILVGVGKKSDREVAIRLSLGELQSLTETAGGTVSEVLLQKLEQYRPGTLIGLGKISEVAEAARRHRARTVIFDEELSPAQQKSLETALTAKVLDRTRLILDIFAQRARTREGELQVELAQLSYLLPRLTGRWRAYSQQVGGIGTRGPGERQLEYERRHIQRRIQYLKRAIERIEAERRVQRDRRRSVPVPQVAIIGYTNVGKSTLLNALTREGAVYADDKLFATLDPTTRRVRLPEGGWAVFTDTVGFIQKLPTPLIAAFRSTLEEVTLADCLVHVLDATAPNPDLHKRAVEGILRELRADRAPRVEAINKVDRLSAQDLKELRERWPDAILISARDRRGLAPLLTTIQETLHDRWVLREVSLNPGEAWLVAELYRSTQVLSQRHEGDRILVRLRITPENWSRLQVRLQRHICYPESRS